MMTHNTCNFPDCTVEWYSLDAAERCDRHEGVPVPGEPAEPSVYYQHHTGRFPDVRAEALARDGACVECGVTNEEHIERPDLWPPNGGLHAHHLVDVAEFEDPDDAHTLDNIVMLCGPCHKEATCNR